MIHRALKLLRNYHNMKQKDLASKLEISASHLSEIESGIKPVAFDLLQKYSKIFDVPVSSIALFAEKAEDPTSIGLKQLITSKALRMMEWLDTVSQYDDTKRPTDEQTYSV
jgi:transcriptional regulator with XRE-family HTH domain